MGDVKCFARCYVSVGNGPKERIYELTVEGLEDSPSSEESMKEFVSVLGSALTKCGHFLDLKTGYDGWFMKTVKRFE